MKSHARVLLAAVFAVCTFTSQPTLADDCTLQIAAMFTDGPLDAYQRPPHRHEKQVVDSAGNVSTTFQSIVENPLRTISGIKGGTMTLTIDDDTWTGPGPSGPWTSSENNNPKNREPWHKAMQAQQAKNLTATECANGVTLDGNTWNMVRYSTKTDPNPDMNNAFFGWSDIVYIDPKKMQVMRLEQTGFFSSWLPEPGKDTHITLFTYEPDVKVTAPE